MSSNGSSKLHSPPPTSSDSDSLTIKKPAISYAALIAQALMESPDGRLALPEIYAWIQDHYEYYRLASPAWKNSIRHNLSMNRAFCKAEPPPNAAFKCSYWQFAVPTRVKIGSKGKATVSTTSLRQRSRSVSHHPRDGVGKATSEPAQRRRFSADAMAPIRPRPSIDFASPDYTILTTSQSIQSTDLNGVMNTESLSSGSSTVIMLSSSDGSSPPREETLLEPFSSFYTDFPPAIIKPTWTPPPGDLEEAFHFSHDPLIPTQNIRSPMLR